MYFFRLTVYVLLLASATVRAHEYWIEPFRFKVAASERIVADLRTGQYFKGNSQVFLPDKFVAFTVTDASGTRPIEGRMGDLPAVNIPTRETGLHVLALHTAPSSITHADFAKFEQFLHREGLDWVLDAHFDRGLGKDGIKELFSRYAKSLIQVGESAGRDRAVGMPFELVAETNPYTDPTVAQVEVQLLFQGEAQPNAQIAVFNKREGCGTTRETTLTDAGGRARIPVDTGGRFLINAVHMVTLSPERRTDAVWESLWASLTFELPEHPGVRCEPVSRDAEFGKG